MIRALIAALALLGLVAGCSSTASDDTGHSGQSIAARQQTTQGVVPGYTISVDRLGIANAPMVGVGLNADGTLQVPSLNDPKEIGVYTGGPMPGATGPAVVVSHINAHGVDGSFAHLPQMQVGDRASTRGPNGSVTTFVVYKNETMPKSGFKSADVYSDTAGPELRLISCTGPLDAAQHEYLENVVIYLRKI